MGKYVENKAVGGPKMQESSLNNQHGYAFLAFPGVLGMDSLLSGLAGRRLRVGSCCSFCCAWKLWLTAGVRRSKDLRVKDGKAWGVQHGQHYGPKTGGHFHTNESSVRVRDLRKYRSSVGVNLQWALGIREYWVIWPIADEDKTWHEKTPSLLIWY